MKQHIIILLCLCQCSLAAQQAVRLSDCRRWAREAHPLLRQQAIRQQSSALKLDNIRSADLPEVKLNATASYQSDVPHINLSVPGVTIPEVAKDQYKTWVDLRQNIWDGGVSAAASEQEKAQLKAGLQGVEVGLYQTLAQVNELFFNSFILQENLRILEQKVQILRAQEDRLESGVRNGAALASELDVIRAELIRLKQQQGEIRSGRESTLASLAILTGRQPGDMDELVLEPVEFVPDNALARPEQQYYERQVEALEASAAAVRKKRNPKLYGFGQAGYGRPGLNLLDNDFRPYYLVGLGLNWRVFDWKNSSREAEALRLQQEMVKTEEEQFERNVRMAMDRTRRRIVWLNEVLEQDRELVRLREQITASSASRHENGAMTASDYIRDLNEEVIARVTLETHRVQLEAARADYYYLKGDQKTLKP